MEQKHRNILQTSFLFLTKNIYNVEAVCDYLVTDEILTTGMVEEIKHKKPAPTAQVRHMLSILPRRGKKAYESFVAALIKTENKDSSDFLRAKENPSSSQNSVQPKPKDVSGDVQESTKSHDEKGDNSKKSEGPSQTTQDKDWPDLQKKVQTVQKKEIQFSSEEGVTRISENNKTYHMTGKKKGKLIIISNVPEHCKTDSCKPGRTRTSSNDMDFDKTSIQQLFKYMKFEFKAKDGLQCQTGEELKNSLKEIGEDTESSYDSLVVVILSGGNGFKPGQIYDKDGVMIPRDDVLQIIRDSPAFKGKPKIVIIRTYSFEDDSESYDTLDAGKALLDIRCTPNNDDMFVVSSSPMTKMGPWMIGDNGNGSYFIQAFIHVFKNQAHEKSFLQLIEEVNKLLHTAMVPELIEGKYSDKCTKTHVAEAVVLEYSKEIALFLFPGQTDIPVITMKDWPDLQNVVQTVQKKEIRFSSKEDVTWISENHKIYHMTGKNKGKLIIISNLTEQCKTDSCKPGRTRTCSRDVDFDKTSIQQLFKLMEFKFKPKDGLQGQTGEELKKSLKEIGEDTESSYDSLVVVILSGGNGFEPGQIYDKNGAMIPRDDVLQIIRDSPAFKGKPKIVIIRTYSFEDDSKSYDTLDAGKALLDICCTPNNDDMFVVSSSPKTKMGPWMMGDKGNGSYFIQAFIHVFKNQAYEKSFLQLIEEVNKLLRTAMVPESIEGKSSDKCTKTHVAEAVVLEYSKEKELFLFPGLCDIPMKISGWPDLKNAGNKLNKKEIQMSAPEFYSRKMTGGQQVYHMSCTGVKRGKVIWISNIHCPNIACKNDTEDQKQKIADKFNSCRNHIDFDKTNVTLLLKEIGFDSKAKDQIKDKTTEEIKQFLTDRLAEVDKDNDVRHDSLIVMILSGKVGCSSAEIYDKDGNIVPMKEILQILKDSQHFKGKPKIVIIQTYNFQESTFFDETDSVEEMKVPNADDLFVVSSFPRIEQGPWMIGENMTGSYFIQALIHIMKNHTHDKSFLELMKEVHKCLLNVDIPEKDKDGKYIDKVQKKHVADVVLLEHSKEKELYFFPGIKIPLPEGQTNLNIPERRMDLGRSLEGKPVCSPSN